jgi:gluconokinase
MGVAGSGKTTAARLFAEKTGAVFYEGDDFHPPENIAKMRAGIALTDKDRAAWLRSLRKITSDALANNTFIVLTCSALKAKYREQLQGGDPRVRFVYLTAPRAVIESRIKARRDHYMPASLLDSQLATLEPPTDAFSPHCEKSPEQIVAEVIQAFCPG